MKIAAPNFLAALTATIALGAGGVLAAGDPAVFDTRQASLMAYDTTPGQADEVSATQPAPVEAVKVVAPAPAPRLAGVRS